MDWNLKTNSGYLSEFDQESFPSISPIDGSISFESPGSRGKGQFSFDLKLGQMGNNSGSRPSSSNNKEPMVSKWKEAAGAKLETFSASGSSKRARANGNGNQKVLCLVDGCNSDLSNCREYHRRHKVCEVHSKTPVVTINGQKQRFCQQCSRFHSLEEFDEGKRSCRKRLDGHNRRRRKSQTEPMSRLPVFLSNFQGTKMLQFSSLNVFQGTNVGNLSRVEGIVNPTLNFVDFDQKRKPSLVFPVTSQSSGSGYRADNRFTFLQDANRDSDCALSLLSSSSQHTQSSTGVGLSHHNSPAQPLPSGSEPVNPVLVFNGTDNNVVGYGSELFVNAGESALPGNETAPRTFPVYWD